MTDTPLSPFKMNLPSSLRDQLSELAKRNNRSLSGEIISRLELSVNIDAQKAMDTLMMADTILDTDGLGKPVRQLLRDVGSSLGLNVFGALPIQEEDLRSLVHQELKRLRKHVALAHPVADEASFAAALDASKQRLSEGSIREAIIHAAIETLPNLDDTEIQE
ncbi:Arc family DNA-binding protein [Cohaesibacter marisflavi]|uniref:Arc family DNA-binding protein n=1 Tax=Cohaesibacter marisflavi TaxID=655353 RepID=UPI0029C86D78|nr:Arc family DNA-binding protein [Cohaesibacter marisflavi]